MARGLLSRNAPVGLLSMVPVNTGATPEALRRKREEEAARLAAEQRAQTPERAAVNPLRVALRTIFSGEDPFSALDAERARLEAEAMRPQMAAQREQVLSTITDPRERALFMTDPGAWAENVGYQFRPRTLAPGSVERLGGQTVGAAPIVERFDDRFGVFDPLDPRGDARYTTPRGPTFDEVTGREKAQADAALAAQRLEVDRYRADVDAEVGLGGLGLKREELDLKRDEINREREQATAAEAAQASAAAETARGMETTISRALESINGAGAWNHLNPLARQSRANLTEHIVSLQGNITFDKLMEMKRNSPTGASGLGALSDSEARMLANTVTALNVDMSPEELRRSFGIIADMAAKMRQPAPASGGITREQAIEELRRRGRL